MGVMLATKNIAFLSAVILCMVVFVVGAAEQSESDVTPTSLTSETGTEKECDCGPHGKCVLDSRGKEICHCDDGYQEDSVNGTCGECDCGEKGRCVLVMGEKNCFCPYQYAEKDGICTECTCSLPWGDGNIRKFECRFENGVEICICPDGFKTENNKCIDIDECLDPTSCHNDTRCENYPGYYMCSCKAGYTGINEDAKTYGCRDIDECVEYGACSSHNESTNCINTDGSFYCECRPGYSKPKGFESEIGILGCEKDGLGTGYIILIVAAVIVVVAGVAVAGVVIVKRRCMNPGYRTGI